MSTRNTVPLVSIVTLNWNATEVTCEFLESSRNLTYDNYEILVCDMNSDEDPTSRIESLNVPHTRVLRSDKNRGFSGGNNWGIRQAKGDYIFIVNNDTELTPDILQQLLAPFQQDPSIGVTCPKIRFYYNRSVIQYAGFNPVNIYTGRTTAVGNKEEDKGQHDTPGYTAGAHGCAMMVSREVIEKTGAFPEVFFLYYEEWDWSARIIKNGFKIYYQAEALIYHKESISVGKASPMKVYYQTRNRILFMRRNSRKKELFVFLAFYSLVAFPKSVLKFSLKGQFAYLKSVVNGTFWNLRSSSYSEVI
ncbi:MAG: glycosyltransferase family 2 protein [Chitinophagaceae bacterium]